MNRLRLLQRFVLVLGSIALLHGVVYAQKMTQLQLSPADYSTAVAPGSFQYHQNVIQGGNREAIWRSEPSRAAALSAATSGASAHNGAGLGPGTPTTFFPVVYPGFLSNPSNNPTLQFTQQHPVYVNSPSNPVQAHWGNPDVFLTDLNGSSFIHSVDQYTLNIASNRYPVGAQYAASGAVPHVWHLNDASFINLLHTLGLAGNGYGHIYHIFLPQGQDFCFDNANTQCYSPDAPNSFVFCAFHSAGTFNDAAGHVIFSLEPYQNISGCQVTGTQTTSFGHLTDSTASTLSHETFEAITDPDLNAWYNRDDLDLFGAENGDQCQSRSFNYGTVLLANFHFYQVQSEYSNFYNGCSYF